MNIPRRRSAAVPFLILPIVCLALAACGSSGGSSTASVSQAAATSTASGGAPTGSGAGRFAALRSCLQKQGITLPQRPAGTRAGGPGSGQGGGGVFGGGSGAAGGGGRGFFGGATGANASKLRAALAKCGFTPRTGATGGGGFFRRRLTTPTVVAALNKFAACMRSNGVNVPAPNTSGSGPLFDTKGLDTTSASFKAAEAKCLSDLKGVFPGGFGARGATGSSGASTNNAS